MNDTVEHTVIRPKNYAGSAKLMARDADRARQSTGEDSMADMLSRLPVSFERQYLYAAGRKLRADFAVWNGISQRLCLIFVDGGVYTRQAHGSIKGVLADIDRANEACINKWRVLRVTPKMIESGKAMALLERLLL